MHKTVDVRALFNEASAQELSLAGLQADQKVKNDDNKVVCFMWALRQRIIERWHHLVHQPMDRNQFEDWTWHISDILKPS